MILDPPRCQGTGTVHTVGRGGNFATIAAAMLDASVVNGDRINVIGTGYYNAATNPYDLTTTGAGALSGSGFNIVKAVRIDGGASMTHMDFATVNTETTGNQAGYSGGNPWGSLGAIVPNSVGGYSLTGLSRWTISTPYAATGATDAFVTAVVNGGNVYRVVTAGTSASSGGGPTGTGTSISDGSVVWAFIQTYQDCILSNFIISGSGLAPGTFGSIDGVRINAPGRVTIDNCAFIDNSDGIGETSNFDAVTNVTNCVFFNNGIAYTDPTGHDHGFGENSHNIYLTNIGQFNVTKVITVRPLEAHPIKTRGNELHCIDVITESQHGSCVNIPDGGLFTWTGTLTGAGNASAIMFKNRSASASDEKTLFDYADEPPTTSLGPTTYPISASNPI